MGLEIVQVDAFTDRPFAGNPAAVCLLAEEADPAWMQAVASEMNLSETAFLLPEGPPGAYGLRWFTPTVEVELHAQLTARDFYARAGYVAEGEEFDDAGIPHVLMRRPLSAPPPSPVMDSS